ncbi:MAG: NADH-quinone oxidoreductase subunit J [Elusimicrobiota bacterium]|jgi:NADH-quinone oxidoreductase subunit J|nr:NADH-quinone oxidoreductase subunit J [Elusimicrobiota bacterium]
MSLHLFLVISMILCSLAAVMAKRTIHAAIFLALVSIILATIMFTAQAPWAGAVELSVCAGLITVLFASTASMIGRGESYAKRESKIFRFLPLGLIIFGVIILCCGDFFEPLFANTHNAAAPSLTTVGDIIWKLRTPDLIGQLCIFVAGVLTVRTMLGEGKDE